MLVLLMNRNSWLLVARCVMNIHEMAQKLLAETDTRTSGAWYSFTLRADDCRRPGHYRQHRLRRGATAARTGSQAWQAGARGADDLPSSLLGVCCSVRLRSSIRRSLHCSACGSQGCSCPCICSIHIHCLTVQSLGATWWHDHGWSMPLFHKGLQCL